MLKQWRPRTTGWPRGIFGSASELNALFRDFSSPEGIEQLRKRGFKISHFRSTTSFEHERAIFKDIRRLALSHLLHFGPLKNSAVVTVKEILLEFLLNPPSSVDFARHFTKSEFISFAQLAYQTAEREAPFPIVAPVCPDYPEVGYELGSDVSLTAKRFLDVFPSLVQPLERHGCIPSAMIHVADTEIEDRFLSTRLRDSREEFLRKTAVTQDAIQREIRHRSLTNVVVSSMLGLCEEKGIAYAERQEACVEKILKNPSVKTTKVLDRLVKERTAIGDFQDLGLVAEEYRIAAAYELAGYAVYGDIIGADAFICSPDAESAVPAYNMLKEDKANISPTAFVKRRKDRSYELFYE